MIARAKRTGRGELVKGFRRKQKRKPRRLLEASPQDWERWDRFAQLEGANWSEFTRRALEQRCTSIGELAAMAAREPSVRIRLPGLPPAPEPVRKTSSKMRISTRAKKRLRDTPAGKRSSRT